MAEERAQRRLAAILAADVVGYSRLMGASETRTLAALKTHRRELVDARIAEHQGRIVKVTGDGLLVEFPSVVNAVTCAVEIQRKMIERNADVPEDQRIEFRIGVNLGDIIFEDNDIFGDGVNVAARIESIAEPGGVCISSSVRDSVGNRLDLAFEDIGEQTLKNIDRPVRVYSISIGATLPRARTALPAAAKDKPSIAVMPFTNLSGDLEQQYFSDGITADIITELSRYKDLLVIARNSSFQFRDKSVDIKHVGRELGANYIVEGSVRTASGRIRITAQLIEAASGAHLWADRYDRELMDVFDIQDEVTQTIAATLVGQLGRTAAERARRKPTELWAAYDYFLRGTDYTERWDANAAIPLLRKAIELDPSFSRAYAELALAYMQQYYLDDSEEALNMALAYARQGLDIDENDAACHAAMGLAQTIFRRFDLAEAHCLKAVALNPNSVHFAALNAYRVSRSGQPGEALAILDTVAKHDPLRPMWYHQYQGWFLFEDRRYSQAIEVLSRVSPLQYWDHIYLAASHAYLGRELEARAEAAEVLRMKPHFTLSRWSRMQCYKNSIDAEHELLGLRMAGLPEN